MLLDVAMGEPNSGMFGYKTNRDTFPGAYQNRIPSNPNISVIVIILRIFIL
jgi:hypothetical protein